MDDRGFATPALFVVVIGGLLMLGLALDVALYAASWRETAHLADVAAETGAGVIDEKAVYQGDLLLDRPGSRRTALDLIQGSGHRSEVRVTRRRVCVTLTRRYRPRFLSVVGAGVAQIQATSCARPRQG